jgi:uncharacterized protein
MKIRISGLADGIHGYHFSEYPLLLGSPETDNFSDKVNVDVALEKGHGQILLKASIQTTRICICDRCLASFAKPLTNSYEMVYMYDSLTPPSGDEEEVKFITRETHEIDIAEDVRQMICLAVPMKMLCRDDCAGLCPVCGSNLNSDACGCKDDDIDLRWAVLRQTGL